MGDVRGMRIAVLGAGAMGSVYGARLADGGAEVTLLDVNQSHLDAIARDGLEVALDEGTKIHRLAAVRPEDFRGPVDVVLVFTKIFHTAAALGAVAGQLDGAVLLSLQNGIGNGERLAVHVPAERTLVGMTMTPAGVPGSRPGRLSRPGEDGLLLRRWAKQADPSRDLHGHAGRRHRCDG